MVWRSKFVLNFLQAQERDGIYKNAILNSSDSIKASYFHHNAFGHLDVKRLNASLTVAMLFGSMPRRPIILPLELI